MNSRMENPFVLMVSSRTPDDTVTTHDPMLDVGSMAMFACEIPYSQRQLGIRLLRTGNSTGQLALVWDLAQVWVDFIVQRRR